MDATRHEIVTRRVVYSLNSPAPLGEIGKAIQVARLDCAKARSVDVDKLYDDDVMVKSSDEKIQIYYEVEVSV